MSHIDTSAVPSARGSLSVTAEEPEDELYYSYITTDSHGSARFTPLSRKSARASIVTSHSDVTTLEWFDAPDGGEEFFLESSDELEPTPVDEKSEGQGGLGSSAGSRSSFGGSINDLADDTPPIDLKKEVNPAKTALKVTRRTQLPSGPVGDEGSLFAVLKKNVGKVGFLMHFKSDISSNQCVGLIQCGVSRIIQRAYHFTAKCRGTA